jgi:hypothetical protein
VTGYTQSLTIAADADRILVASCGVDDNEDSNPTFGAVFNTTETCTNIASLTVDVTGGQDLFLDMRRRIAPTATTADLVFSGVLTAHRVFFGWTVLYGVHQTTPEGTVGYGSAITGDTHTGSCTGAADGMSLGFCFLLRTSSPTITDGGTQTARTETEGINARCAGSLATLSGSGANDFSWTSAGGTMQGWGVVAMPFQPSAAAVTAVYVPYPDAWNSVGWMEAPWMAGKAASRSFLYKPKRVYVEVP